jgi:hypothetical protein
VREHERFGAGIKNLAQHCEENHGQVLREFVKSLIDERNNAKVLVDRYVAAFIKRVRDPSDGNLAKDLAEKAGLIYAGGRLAIRFKLVSWTPKHLRKAIAKAYRGALALLPDEGVLLRSGIDILRQGLRRLPSIERLSLEKADLDQIDGFRRKKKGRDCYSVRCEAFNTLFDNVDQREAIIAWLIEKKWITLAGPKNGKGKRKPKVQFTWPDGERHRSLEITLPRRRRKRPPGSKKSARE